MDFVLITENGKQLKLTLLLYEKALRKVNLLLRTMTHAVDPRDDYLELPCVHDFASMSIKQEKMYRQDLTNYPSTRLVHNVLPHLKSYPLVLEPKGNFLLI
jgi:hypothetical protein